MKLDWSQLNTTIARCLNSARKGERGALRVHCNAAERMLKGVKHEAAKELLDKVHHARTSLEMERAVTFLESAQEIAGRHAT